jgi:hypothetical protein
MELAMGLRFAAVVWALSDFWRSRPASKFSNMSLVSNWHAMRIFRAAIAIYSIVEFVNTQDWLFLVFGGILGVQAVFDIGCCGSAGCGTAAPRPRQQANAVEEIEFEEIK